MENNPVERARECGRGVAVFRPAEAAVFLGCNRAVVDAAMREYVESAGRRGLAHFFAGRGKMIRREAIDQWMIQRERAVIGA
jgi:hypothetical protein